jgi:hypothetical protein
MNDVSVVSRLPVRPVEAGTEGDVEELQQKLVPVEEEQLPQGVADLLATLIWRQRPMAGVGRVELRQTQGLDRGVGEPRIQTPRNLSPVLDQARQMRRLQLAISQIDRSMISSPPSEVAAAVSPKIERMALIEPVSLNQPTPLIEQATADLPIESLPKTAPLANGLSNTPSVALPVMAPLPTPTPTLTPTPTPLSAPASPPVPVIAFAQLEVTPSSRDFLQVPFNKGAAHGQVTISRLPGESMQNLVLSPSNPQVLEHLREPFDQVRDTHWRLRENTDDQQRQGSRQSPEDEQEEHQEPGA